MSPKKVSGQERTSVASSVAESVPVTRKTETIEIEDEGDEDVKMNCSTSEGFGCPTCTYANTAAGPCAMCGAMVPPTQMISCPACTFLNAEGTKACNACNTPLSTRKRPATEAVEPSEHKRVC